MYAFYLMLDIVHFNRGQTKQKLKVIQEALKSVGVNIHSLAVELIPEQQHGVFLSLVKILNPNEMKRNRHYRGRYK